MLLVQTEVSRLSVNVVHYSKFGFRSVQRNALKDGIHADSMPRQRHKCS